MSKFRKSFPLVLALSFAGFCSTQCTVAEEELLTIGSKAPSIDVEHWVSQGNGRFDKVTSFEPGKVYVIEFWATWCGPCIASMPHLAELQERFADKGVQLVSISDEDLDTVQSFLDRPVQNRRASDSDGESESTKLTYGKLTSVYSLTTDPDRSVHRDYMEAAGQNGIPTAFIVGKDSRIEWIGHPMKMDLPLEQVVEGTWDRESARQQILAEQQKGLIATKINKAMRSGDAASALGIIDDAIRDYPNDSQLIDYLKRARVQVQLFPIAQLARSGKNEEALSQLAELKKSSPEQASSFVEFELSVLLNANMHDQAAMVLDELAVNESNPLKLNQITWMIYEMSKEDNGFSEKLLASAIAAAKKATELIPDEGAVLDTYAHLLHRSGKLDDALAAQAKAVKLAGESNPEAQAFLEQLRKEKAEADQSK